MPTLGKRKWIFPFLIILSIKENIDPLQKWLALNYSYVHVQNSLLTSFLR